LAHVTKQELTECLRGDATLSFEVMEILSHEISGTRSVIKRLRESGNGRLYSG